MNKESNLYDSCLSTVGYLFLRGVMGKESYSEPVYLEFSEYIANLAEAVRCGEVTDVKRILAYELREGDYDFSSFEGLYILYVDELEITEEDICTVLDLYKEMIAEIEKEAEDSEREQM